MIGNNPFDNQQYLIPYDSNVSNNRTPFDLDPNDNFSMNEMSYQPDTKVCPKKCPKDCKKKCCEKKKPCCSDFPGLCNYCNYCPDINTEPSGEVGVLPGNNNYNDNCCPKPKICYKKCGCDCYGGYRYKVNMDNVNCIGNCKGPNQPSGFQGINLLASQVPPGVQSVNPPIPQAPPDSEFILQNSSPQSLENIEQYGQSPPVNDVYPFSSNSVIDNRVTYAIETSNAILSLLRFGNLKWNDMIFKLNSFTNVVNVLTKRRAENAYCPPNKCNSELSFDVPANRLALFIQKLLFPYLTPKQVFEKVLVDIKKQNFTYTVIYINDIGFNLTNGYPIRLDIGRMSSIYIFLEQGIYFVYNKNGMSTFVTNETFLTFLQTLINQDPVIYKMTNDHTPYRR